MLTNGDEYRIYNAHAAVGVEEKLFRTVKVSEDAGRAAETLALLSKERMRENDLEALWRDQFVDRQVRAAIEEAFAPESDAIVRLIRKLAPELTAGDVRGSLARMKLAVEFPMAVTATAHTTEAQPRRVAERGDVRGKQPAARDKGREKGQANHRVDPQAATVTVQDLLRAGLMRPPFKLSVRYRGRDLEAVVLADGTVRCLGETVASLSTAGAAARASVIGPRPDGSHPATNGWGFWKCTMPDGSHGPVSQLRDLYLARHGGEGGPELRIVKGGA